MRTQIQMLNHLNENISTHSIESKDNKIIAKRMINHRSFSSFTITYLKKGGLSIKVGSYTKRFDNEDELIVFIGSFAGFNGSIYEEASERLDAAYQQQLEEETPEEEVVASVEESNLFSFSNETPVVIEEDNTQSNLNHSFNSYNPTELSELKWTIDVSKHTAKYTELKDIEVLDTMTIDSLINNGYNFWVKVVNDNPYFNNDCYLVDLYLSYINKPITVYVDKAHYKMITGQATTTNESIEEATVTIESNPTQSTVTANSTQPTNPWTWTQLTESLKPERKAGDTVPTGYLTKGHNEYYPYSSWVHKGYVTKVIT